MKKRLLILLTALIALFTFNTVAFAESKEVRSGNSDFTTYQSNYNIYPTLLIQSEKQVVTIYGYSSCTVSSGCTYSYQGVKSTNLEELLSNSIKCSNGSKKINYSPSVQIDEKLKSSTNLVNDEVYWSEEYTVTCTDTGNVTVDDTGNTGTAATTTRAASKAPGSATGTDNVDTGVETYYVVLFVVAIVSYLLMRVIKKYNLFKSI